MTTPPPAAPPVDAGNALLAETPAQWTTCLISGPLGQRCVVTIRTPSTTLTLLLAKDEAERLADQIKTEAGKMSGTGLIVANGNGLPVHQGPN